MRVLDLTGFWQLHEQDNGQAAVTYQVHFDPQVGPKGPANSTTATSVFETLKNISRLVQQEKIS